MASKTSLIYRPIFLLFILATYFFSFVASHEHHDEELPEGQVISFEPVDGILWAHIFIMTLTFGVLFPTGMILGLSKSRWHVPTQAFASCLAIVGWFLGHAHKGRQFAHNIHSSFAPFVAFLFIGQVVFGIYLKFHFERGINKYIRRAAVLCHGTIGKITPIISWIQMGFGGITLLGFCRADHLGQCLAHGIMGSSFIAYGAVMSIMLLVGQAWLIRRNKSQEFFDSAVIAAWGLVNSFTEHRWGSNWSHKDFQHTSMGVIWFCAGVLGVFLSSRKGKPQRNIVPAIVIIMTGWAMAGHAQSLEFSTHLHGIFGHTLMAAGVTRIIEIVMVLRDANNAGDDEIRSFQYLPPYLLIASGLLFMGANEEQIQLLVSAKIDHVSYTLIIYSVAFVVYFFVLYLIRLYTVTGRNAPDSGIPKYPNGNLTNGHTRMTSMEQRRVRDVEEFELGALLDEEDEDAVERDSDNSLEHTPLAKRSSIERN